MATRRQKLADRAYGENPLCSRNRRYTLQKQNDEDDKNQDFNLNGNGLANKNYLQYL